MTEKNTESTLFMPMKWWAEILPTIDKKIQFMSQNYGYGNCTVEFVIKKGVVKDIVFKDEVRVRQDFSELKDKVSLTPASKK